MMKKYLKNPHVWSMLPIVCALSYNLAPGGLYILYMYTFPIIWVAAGYQAYTTEADVKKTLLKLHIPILICLPIAIVHATVFGMEIGFIENNNEVIGLSGSIAQKVFAPMSLAGAWAPVPRNHIMFFPVQFITSTIMMFVFSYFGTRMKAWGQS
ncbi:MAG: hypothetical protein J6A39_08620 [Peptococcaceae bacterium]|nr:hypothetical protein [Peptococcaceae bacterium]